MATTPPMINGCNRLPSLAARVIHTLIARSASGVRPRTRAGSLDSFVLRAEHPSGFPRFEWRPLKRRLDGAAVRGVDLFAKGPSRACFTGANSSSGDAAADLSDSRERLLCLPALTDQGEVEVPPGYLGLVRHPGHGVGEPVDSTKTGRAHRLSLSQRAIDAGRLGCDCKGSCSFPRSSKNPHPQVMSQGSSVRASPSFSLSLNRQELSRILTATA